MTGMSAVIIYASWMLVLTFIYVGYRVGLVLIGRKKANAWTRGQATDDPGFITRAQHAHMNCVENFPIFAALVFVAAFLSKSAVVNDVALYVIILRLAQSIVHLTGTSHWLVFIRANLFVLQLLIYVCIIYRLVA